MNLVPVIVDKENNGERSYDIFSRLLKDRIILLSGEIDDNLANIIVSELLYLDSLNHEDISLYINSPGGSIYDGFAIIDTMNYIEPDVQTIGIGLQASMGSLLLSSGTKGKRFCLPNARVMIHQPSSGTEGKITDQEIALKEGIELKKIVIDMMVKNTGKDRKTIERDMDRDNWMSAKEALEYGIIELAHQVKRTKQGYTHSKFAKVSIYYITTGC